MQLTPEQQQEVQCAKAAGERRVMLRFTPEQKVEWQAAVHEELAGKEENIAHVRKLEAAAEQPGFFGDVRRAISHSRRPLAELATSMASSPRSSPPSALATPTSRPPPWPVCSTRSACD